MLRYTLSGKNLRDHFNNMDELTEWATTHTHYTKQRLSVIDNESGSEYLVCHDPYGEAKGYKARLHKALSVIKTEVERG